MIVGGSLEEKAPHNTLLTTKQSFGNFVLTLKIRIRGAGGFMNSGIQIRSTLVPTSQEMKGYQVDAGPGWWGKLYNESCRNNVIGKPKDAKALAAVVGDRLRRRAGAGLSPDRGVGGSRAGAARQGPAHLL